jgi:hypothetical protein
MASSVLSIASSAGIDPFEGLEGSRIIHYSRLQAFSQALQELKTALSDGKTTNQFLIVRGVDEKTMNHIEKCSYKGVRCEWHEDLQLLIVKVPTGAHEAATGEFSAIIIEAVGPGLMGLNRHERSVLNSTTFRAPSGTPRKEPDWAMKTRIVRPNSEDFPTIVVETGFSESLARLRNDARLWFSISNNAIQIVILIAIKAARREIIFEMWTVAAVPAGRRTTRHTPAQVPQPAQSITISETAPNTYAITAGTAPLILEFDKLFLRQPVRQEHDIIYTQTDLFSIAEAAFDMI